MFEKRIRFKDYLGIVKVYVYLHKDMIDCNKYCYFSVNTTDAGFKSDRAVRKAGLFSSISMSQGTSIYIKGI